MRLFSDANVKKNVMKNCLAILLFTALYTPLSLSQKPFSIDASGYLPDSTVKRLINQRGYNLIGLFGKAKDSNAVRYAKFMREGKVGTMDEYGNDVIMNKYDHLNDELSPSLILVDIFDTLQNKKKYGLQDSKGQLVLPVIYDHIDLLLSENGYTKIELNHNYGLIDPRGKIIVEPKYNEISYFSNGYARIRINKKEGYVDLNGNEIIPPKYDYVEAPVGGVSIFKILDRNDKEIYGLADTSGHELLFPEYDDMGVDYLEGYFGHDVDYAYNGFIKVHKGDKVGIIGNKGNIIIQAVFDNIRLMDGNLFEVTNITGENRDFTSGVYNSSGKNIIPVKYDNIASAVYMKGLITYIGGKHGLYNYEGKKILDDVYEDIDFINDSLIELKKDGKVGVCRIDGEMIIPVKYDYINSGNKFSGFLIAKQNNKYGLFSDKGALLAPAVYDDIDIPFFKEIIPEDRLIKVKTGNKYGLLNNSGKVVIPIANNYIHSFRDGTIICSQDDSVRLYDIKANYKQTLPFQDISLFNKKLNRYKLKNKWGLYYKESGKIAAPAIYTEIKDFNYNYAIVRVGYKRGMVNGLGTEIASPIYDDIAFLNTDLMHVKTQKKHGVINTSNGSLTIDTIYDEIKPIYTHSENYKEMLIQVKKGNKIGVSDTAGKMILPVEYDFISDFSYQHAIVAKDKKLGLIDMNARITIPVNYQDLDFLQEGMLVYKEDDYKGVIRTDGKLISPAIYTNVDVFSKKLIKVGVENRFGLIDITGKTISGIDFNVIWIDSSRRLDWADCYKDDLKGNIDFYGNVYLQKR